MSFEKGNASFRIFIIRDELPADVNIPKFAARCAPPIDTLSTSPISGWVTWRHLFDINITDEKCYFPPWFHVALMKAEKKIPPKLLRAYCRMGEDTEMRARNLEFLSRKQKAEIKARVVDELTPQMPPTLTSIPTIVNFNRKVIYAEAMSQSQLDVFGRVFRETTGQQLFMMDAPTAAIALRRVNFADISPALFTDDESVTPDSNCHPGLEFLTWMLFRADTAGGEFRSRIDEQCYFMLEGPVTFFREGKGAHEAVLRRGSPIHSRECGIALLCGKKLKSAKLTMAIGERTWTCSVSADFAIRGLKLPKDEEEKNPTFEDRMTMIDTFVNAFLDLYDSFIKLRTDVEAWKGCVEEMRQWAHLRAEEEPGGEEVEEGLEID